MESMTGCISKIAELQYRLTQNKDVIITLQEIMAEKAQYQSRYDQVQCLDTLKGRVEREVHNMRRMETAASNGFEKATLLAGAVEYTVAGLIAWLVHSNEHPLSVGARWATSWEEDKPFGTIVVAIGPEGLPDDVKVISVSQLARDQDKEESEVAASLESSYHVMSVESFFGTLEELRAKVLEGLLSLPMLACYLHK